jgi:hypothetical protein
VEEDYAVSENLPTSQYVDFGNEPTGVHIMGRGIAVLIHHELTSVIDEDFEHLREVLASREAQLAVREAKLDEREEDLGAWKRRLADLERVVMAQASELTAPPN